MFDDKKAKEKIKTKTYIYHVDHVLMKELDGPIKLEPEQEEKKQIENENNITNKNEQMIKHLFELINGRDKY